MSNRENNATQINKIVNDAKDFLKKNPFDQGHDLSHHQRVWKLARTIADDINEKVDIDVLKISVMWHDVVVSESNKWSLQKKHDNLIEMLKYLDNLLTSLKFPIDKKRKILNAIAGHEFGSKQLNIEGKVLFDADKLDALDPARWLKVINAVKSRKMNQFQLKMYAMVGKVWLKTMRGKLNFEYSRILHDRMIRKLANNPQARKIALDFGLDLKKYLGIR